MCCIVYNSCGNNKVLLNIFIFGESVKHVLCNMYINYLVFIFNIPIYLFANKGLRTGVITTL